MVKILSVNCQGLGDIAKRRDVFNYLRSLKYNLYCLQDTHPTIDCYNNYKGINNPKARNKVLEMIETYIDPFRQLHEDLSRNTWRKRPPAP